MSNIDVPNYERIALTVLKHGEADPTGSPHAWFNGWRVHKVRHGVQLTGFKVNDRLYKRVWLYSSPFGGAVSHTLEGMA